MDHEIKDFKKAYEATEEPVSAALLVLAERVNQLGFDTNNRKEGLGALEKLGVELQRAAYAIADLNGH